MMSTKLSKPPHPHKSLIKSGGTVSLGVLSSRVLGFVRDMVIAHFLGTGGRAEAFFVAQRIPNLLRDLVGEGAANAAIVPVLAEYQHKKSREEWLQVVHVVMAWGLIILGGVTAAGILLAPWIVRLMVPGFAEDAGKLQLTVDLTRIMFPYLILIALTAFQVGVLYSLNAFLTPAFGPCLFNVAMIASAWAAYMFNWPFAHALAWGVLAGGVAQFAVQWAALRRRGIPWVWPKKLDHPGARKAWSLLVPRIWGSGVYQLNVVVDTFCASLEMIVGAGGVAALYYSSRIIQFPLGVFGYALSSVSLPVLSRAAAAGDMRQFTQTLAFAVRNLTLVLVPCTVVLMVLSHWVIHIVFERGAFSADSTSVTATALFYSAAGLPFYGLSRILSSAFYALHDTKTPVKAATACLMINIVLNAALMFPLKIGGIALASSISSLANTLILWTALRKKLSGSR